MASDVEIIFTPWPYDAVARGVALLNEKIPEWRTEPKHLSLATFSWRTNCSEPEYYGFAVPLEAFVVGGDYDYDRIWDSLSNAWLEAIVKGKA